MYSRSPSPQWPSERTCWAQSMGSGPTGWIEKPRANPRAPAPGTAARPGGLDREAAGEPARLVGLVELLGGDLRRRPLVLAQRVREAAGHLGGALDHHVAADLVVPVAQPRVQQQPRRLDRVARDADGGGAL